MTGGLRHWVIALPILLVVAGLGFRQLDPYPPTVDEFFSLTDAGLRMGGPYAPAEILDAIWTYAPNQMPGYFMLLGAWGSLTNGEIAMARLLSVFFSLLALAIAYRLARDHIAPEAGLFALLIFASNAFFNMCLSHARMYPMLVCFSGLVLWLYLRLINQRERASWPHYVALCGAVFCLISAHAASAKLLAALGFYHLLFAPKNRRWLLVSAAVIAGLLALSPLYPVLMNEGMELSVDQLRRSPLDSVTAMRVWISVFWNDQALLLLLAAGGLALGYWKRRRPPQPHLLVFGFFVISLALLAELTTAMRSNTMRFTLDGLLLSVLFSATGLYVLYRRRKWLGLLVLLWVLAGIHFQSSANWRAFISGRTIAFDYPPSHIISRLARQAAQKPIILGLRYNTFILDWERWSNFGYTQRDHFFTRHGIRLDSLETAQEVLEYPLPGRLTAPELWLVYDTEYRPVPELEAIKGAINERAYVACGSTKARADTIILRYANEARGCQPLPVGLSKNTVSLQYNFFAAELSADNSQIIFVDSWQPLEGESLETQSISLQVIAEDGAKAAQLDRPLAGRGQMRQHVIDIDALPPGRYTLMAVVYNYETGERQPWQGHDGAMLRLGEIVVPAS